MNKTVTAANRDRPWVMRTYAGHSTPEASNRLFRDNLARGQTGLSIAFDLPTQTGHDPDHALAAGEVGKVGVPVSHLGDMERLLDGLPLERMNTSMTINATAPWLLALYVALADAQGADRAALSGTVQNDIVKEYLSRGTYIFPPGPSLRLATDIIAFTGAEMPRWNPINICSYHLQEAGATPVQELAFALANATAVLDAVRARPDVPEERFAVLVGRVSFFVNAGLKLVTEISKMRAFTRLWDEICRERYGVDDAKLRRFRYGVQVNSLGLTEQQPENNVYRILIEMLAVVLSKDARARAVQLPAWNEALGLPRPWDQQWSLRAQQIVAYETDILEHADIFAGSTVVEAKTEALMNEAREELAALGDVLGAVEAGTMKAALVGSNARRLAAIESGAQTVVGVNAYAESADSPLGGAGGIQAIDPQAEAQQAASLAAWRNARDDAAVAAAMAELESAAKEERNVMEASIACAKAGVTTGEWTDMLRGIFGEYRAPTGVGGERVATSDSDTARHGVAAAMERLGRPPRL
ncbi:MAG: methylmalonyl-CoA mutase family protein, partial [Alphaproteobacteria bacterium]|nr:methylmalonyl-CoA mutase family protein [Alphaproteobacteria bacterium]